jgi:hypothetical protein
MLRLGDVSMTGDVISTNTVKMAKVPFDHQVLLMQG